MSNPFNIIGQEGQPERKGEAVTTVEGNNLEEKIKNLISSSDVFLFMKGVPEFPECGFSANTIGILNTLETPYKTFNILTDMYIREGVKQFSNWPTYPQLYFKGQLVGGNDIITEMFEAGELQELIQSK